MEYTENLFSYGTLRYAKVQVALFGRKLEGKEDVLIGYAMKKIKITDPAVIEICGEDILPRIEFSGNPQDRISGMVFKVSPEELAHADIYEIADYKRIQVKLLSGKSAWVYVSKRNYRSSSNMT